MGKNRHTRISSKYKNCYVLLFLLILVGVIITAALQFWPHKIDGEQLSIYSQGVSHQKPVKITAHHQVPPPGDQSCLFHNCFSVYNCGFNDETKISIYVYPQKYYVDEKDLPILPSVSKEFMEIIEAIKNSIYYTATPERACLFVPFVDTLNQNILRLKETGRILGSLDYWKDGSNHVLFNMLPGSLPDFNTTLDVPRGRAVLAGGGFSTWTYRQGFDVAVPVFNPLAAGIQIEDIGPNKPYLLVSAQPSIHDLYKEDLERAVARVGSQYRLLLVEECTMEDFYTRCQDGVIYQYPQILQNGTFCLVLRGARLGQTAFSDALQAGCIPVVVADGFILPFSEVLDWKKAAVQIREEQLPFVMEILLQYSSEKIEEMRNQVRFFWEMYFSSMEKITMTTIEIINDRVFPYVAKKYEEWNTPPSRSWFQNPLFMPYISPKSQGFTAVILTYDRLESLYRVIIKIALAPSLAKVVVVWNNQQKKPPPAAKWPKISKPLKVVQTRHNKLSNRFYPYDEIETEAILAIDDDIVMLTTDEIEFAYDVWREFPDRIVGFPSRLHLWDNSTARWRYESEWTSAISVVLTGASFYHKYYSFLYTNNMPGNIKSWVDLHMNCEDIAMNFLVANSTGKPPIKVTPKKKFKCPECTNVDMLSADLSHMVERSECINKFTEIYGGMPLKTVEFRADPVLYKSDVPDHLKHFSDIGSL